jgi:hypothetical protein
MEFLKEEGRRASNKTYPVTRKEKKKRDEYDSGRKKKGGRERNDTIPTVETRENRSEAKGMQERGNE